MPFFSKEEPEQPEPVEILDRPLRCAICGHHRFWRREAQLHTALGTVLNLDWAAPSATCYVCDDCGYIHWFLPKQ